MSPGARCALHAAAAREALVRHPRHVALGGLVAGLLLCVAPPAAIAGAGALAAFALARTRALLAVAVACGLVGLYVGAARTAALERTALGPRAAAGADVHRDVVLTGPVRTAARGGRTALAELDGEPVLLRFRDTTAGSPAGSFTKTAPIGGLRQEPLSVVGTILRIDGRLRPPDRHARLVHAHAVVPVRAATPTGRHRGGLSGVLDSVRERTAAALAAGLRPDRGALLRGMVLGDDSRIAEPDRQAMRDAGLSHIVAASGQNVVLLATLVLLAGGAVGAGWRARLGVALVLVVLYVPLAGGGPSIRRAGVMGAAGLVAGLAGRPASRWYALLLAAAVTLVLDPRAAGDVGWRLSFLAVIGLAVLAPALRETARARGAPGPLADALGTTVAASLATAPLIASTFGQTSLATLPANVVAAPLVAPVMWLGFVAAAIAQVSTPLASLIAQLAALPLDLILTTAREAASLPGATAPIAPWAVTAVCVLLAIATVAPATRRATPAALIGVVALALALAPRPAPVLAAPEHLRVAMLDIGQGDATLIQHGEHAVLVDTGPPDGPVLARLARLGVRRLDVLVLTHAQDDHDGAGATVLSAIPVGVVLDGRDGVASPSGDRWAAVARARGVPLVLPDAGRILRAGPIALHVRSPRRESAALHQGADPNDRAVVLEVRDGPHRVLLTADAESDVLNGLDLGPVDVLKVAHHGSADAGLPGLLVRLRPAVAVVSAGAGNPFGHPTAATLAALQAGVPVVLRTDRDGTVLLDAAGPAIRVRRMR